jgi:hypothetical protein
MVKAAYTYILHDETGKIHQIRTGTKNLYALRASTESVPKSFGDIENFPKKKEWYDAAQREYDGLLANGTWELVPRPQGRTPIGCKWVFKHKYDANGAIARYKARLTAKGYAQKEGKDYDPDNLYAPVAKHNTLRAFLSIAASNDLEIDQGDVDQAFLIPNLDEEIFMEQPEGYVVEGKEDWVLRLNKSLYGLKQAPQVWNSEIDSYLKNIGFTSCKEDVCLYVKRDSSENITAMLLLYVDDILIAGERRFVDQIKAKLAEKFPFKDLGTTSFILGFEVSRNREERTITLHQHAYVTKILESTNMSLCNPISTPAEAGVSLSASMCPQTDSEKLEASAFPYRQITGALQYLVTGTRPDIAVAVSNVSRFNANPGKQHIAAVKRILRYLKGTSTHGVILGGKEKSLSLVGYSDANWAGDVDTRRSTTGYVFMLGQGPISWKSKLQPSTALSSMESEYMALSSATQEAIWLRRLLRDLGYEQDEPTTIFEDNQGCIKFVKNAKFSTGSKHIDVRKNYAGEAITRKDIAVKYIPTKDMVADIFTKPLPQLPFEKHRSAIMRSA